ncbi:ABC transporter substrate-binding protein [Crenobacter sp. SG2305]|uniref:ABC transporter substrate-binding protein n=1 Tax=Crenobacter oryzisoli TaxID=3056844 RepID=UPI0025AA77AA|nr:ABC transporter substrate-binding protein [Crenobacter sp. SG2305]MDN0081647.1 ABC transporter substrate-binding protein [Crenobacter sp. SG2305]
MKKLALSAVLLLAASGAYAKDWGVIRFGVDPSYAPFESKAPDGKLVGFDIDIGNAICSQLKAKCEWVENAWDGIIPGLKARKFDGILSSMSVTDKRLQQIAFSNKIYHTPTRLVAKKGSGLLATSESLRGRRVGVEQGSTQEAYAKTNWEPKGVSVVSYQNQDLVYQDLQAGRLDAALQDAVQADLSFLKTKPGRDYAFAGAALQDTKTLGVGAAIGLRKDDVELKQAINNALAEIHKNGTYDKIQKKYFSFDING